MCKHRLVWLSAVYIACVLSLTAASDVLAGDCACAKLDAQSFSDTGQCVVDQTRSGFCTLDWRHARNDGTTQGTNVRAEAGAQRIMDYARSGDLPSENPFTEGVVWDMLSKFGGPPFTSPYTGAVKYLESTSPKSYERNEVLASVALLLGSLTLKEDSVSAPTLLSFLSLNAEKVFAKMSGGTSAAPTVTKTANGIIADHSSYGCFEIRGLKEGVEEASGPFTFRVGVRTGFAEDSHCLRAD